MEFPRDSEIIYGGDMCNRRLRGVKVNPIYQEKDAFDNTEGDTSIPVGEIQIDMYESLPRRRKILQYCPDAVFLTSSNEDGRAGSISANDLFIQHTGTSPCPRCRNNTLNPKCRCLENLTSTNITNTTEDTPASESGTGLNNSNNNNNNNHNNMENTGDNNLMRTIVNSNFNIEEFKPNSIDNNDSSGLKERMKNTLNNCVEGVHDSISNISREGSIREGSIREGSIREGSIREGSLLEGGIRDLNIFDEREEDNITDDMKSKSKSDKLMHLNGPKNIYTDALVAFATTSQPHPKNIYSVNSFSSDISDIEFSLKRGNKFCSLENNAILPSYSPEMHYSLPVCPIDFINNNHETVPDQMVILHNSIHKEESPSKISLHSLSNKSNSLNQSPHKNGEQKQQQQHIGLVTVTECDCHGKPTLRCVCGRMALQKLLKQRHLMKSDSYDCSIQTMKSNLQDKKLSESKYSSKSTQNIEKLQEDAIVPDTRETASDEVKNSECSDSNVPIIQTYGKDQINDNAISKSILVNGKRRGSKIQECRIIKFAEGTVFKESKTKYVKEPRRPSFSDKIHLGNTFYDETGGHDNPVFVADEDIPDSVFEDETSFCEGVGPSTNIPNCSVIKLDDGSILLKPDDLNIPAYMHSYILGLSSSVCDIPNKAPPVSIEALGGMTVADFADIEVAPPEDYNRRRRKHKGYDDEYEGDEWLKQNDRKKLIKMCVCMVVVLAVIVAGIGLGIHFGAGNMTKTNMTSNPGGGGKQLKNQRTSNIGQFGLSAAF